MRELMVRLEDMGEHSLVQDAKATLKQLFNDLKNKYVHPQIDTDRHRKREKGARLRERNKRARFSSLCGQDSGSSCRPVYLSVCLLVCSDMVFACVVVCVRPEAAVFVARDASAIFGRLLDLVMPRMRDDEEDITQTRRQSVARGKGRRAHSILKICYVADYMITKPVFHTQRGRTPAPLTFLFPCPSPRSAARMSVAPEAYDTPTGKVIVIPFLLLPFPSCPSFLSFPSL